ncbi:MAG: RES family NAD+ phosphorylase [Gemmatimonadota bacterium]
MTFDEVPVDWAPGFHAKWVERATLPGSLVPAEKRLALEALLRRNRAPDRVERAFTKPFSPSRYTDGSHPAFYAAKDAVTALREKLHHDAKQLRALKVGPAPHPVELLHVDVSGRLDDVRPAARGDASLTHDSDYAACQQLAKLRFIAGSNGLLYPSVRDLDGAGAADCVALFVRSAIGRVATHKTVTVEWNGSDFVFDAAPV